MRAMTAEPRWLQAAASYTAAGDLFDDEPLGFWVRIGRRTIERLALPPGAAVLDVGCGTGASALPAAERVGPRGRVIGVDLAERLLATARHEAERHRLADNRVKAGGKGGPCLSGGRFWPGCRRLSVLLVDH